MCRQARWLCRRARVATAWRQKTKPAQGGKSFHRKSHGLRVQVRIGLPSPCSRSRPQPCIPGWGSGGTDPPPLHSWPLWEVEEELASFVSFARPAPKAPRGAGFWQVRLAHDLGAEPKEARPGPHPGGPSQGRRLLLSGQPHGAGDRRRVFPGTPHSPPRASGRWVSWNRPLWERSSWESRGPAH